MPEDGKTAATTLLFNLEAVLTKLVVVQDQVLTLKGSIGKISESRLRAAFERLMTKLLASKSSLDACVFNLDTLQSEVTNVLDAQIVLEKSKDSSKEPT